MATVADASSNSLASGGQVASDDIPKDGTGTKRSGAAVS